MDISPGRNFIIELTHRPTAKIPRILVFGVHILDLFIDLLKIIVPDHRLTPQDEIPLVRNFQRNISEHFRIVGDNLTDFPVSTSNCLI